jgi:hypothetical protein
MLLLAYLEINSTITLFNMYYTHTRELLQHMWIPALQSSQFRTTTSTQTQVDVLTKKLTDELRDAGHTVYYYTHTIWEE